MAPIKRIGILVQPNGIDSHQLIDCIVAVGSKSGWEHVLLPADTISGLRDFGEGFIDGYIGHFLTQELIDELMDAAIPAVHLCSAMPESTLPRVVTDEVAVGRLAATYLLSLGLPRFGFIGVADDTASAARANGFEEALHVAGHGCHAFFRHTGGDGKAPRSPPDDLRTWVRALPTPIGIFAGSDNLALKLLAVCRKFKISVPKDVAVLGVGNDDLFCNLSTPPLTSIALATQRIAYNGSQMLERLMDGTNLDEREILIPPIAVIPRQSSTLPAILDPDVAAAVNYIALHVKDGLRVVDILRNVQVSRSSLDQRFSKIMGCTLATEIRRAQIELAKRMLSETQEQMPRVAIAAGFPNAKQLSATFHREVGVSPTAYRRRLSAITPAAGPVGHP